MTHKTFWDDPYLTELETRITSVNGAVITCAETILYAMAGGQESDVGTIGGYPVLDAHKDGLEILYTMPDDHALKVGDSVLMTIDWERRYALMRLHFAAEIVLELAYQNIPTIEKIGAHIAQDKSRIDFVWGKNISAYFPMLEAKAADLIRGDHPIISTFSDPAQERRTWEIDGFARVACGGTHLRRTGEVGEITLKRKNIGKGKERIEIYLNGIYG